ncbi:MAG: Atrophin-1 multi-domain protein, partial [Burkholderiaceae bacterium]
FNLMPNGWDNAVAAELDRMRAALRQVVSTSGWLDGNGNQLSPQKVFNVLSMRGASQLQIGTVPGVFDTWQQAVVFPATLTQTVQVNYSSRGLGGVTWANPRAGAQHRLTAIATGGAKLHLKVSDIAGAALFDSGELGNGESIQFAWPVNWAHIVVYTLSGVGQPSSVKGDLRPVW